MKKRFVITSGLALIFLGIFLIINNYKKITGAIIGNMNYIFNSKIYIGIILIISGFLIFRFGIYKSLKES